MKSTGPPYPISLLECMEERQVTIDGQTRKLEEPFLVIATRLRPGHLSLPEAQLDRFLLKVNGLSPLARRIGC